MTRTNLLSKIQIFAMAVMANLAVVMVRAQEKAADLKVDVDVNKGGDAMGGDWMSNPLVWVIGALILIVIIALVARGGGNK
ncbi:hypothetical protein [Kaistella carnis]|uniref:Uncharacterized protein n=1 Tax=Kaistella carnis TaxID=1241979 RepID=A0A3G8XVX2_9FLAO|nr:hypothetical protein [Kaistella carnis]AZI34374.1 hypothetical protein EIB73_14845 [Kaistella carnis]